MPAGRARGWDLFETADGRLSVLGERRVNADV